ncbi:MAG: CRTAC1 family protein [Bythopirellula sp.]|nr:CRTAC1 family protein [Bythopirellula sp.]
MSTFASAVVFIDVTAAAGINHVHTIPELIQGLPGDAFFSGGAAAGDFDGDGHVDLVFARLNDNDIFYRNLGNGTFESRTFAAGFIFPTYTNGVVSGDVDNDGDLDLYMTTVGYTRNYLYLNNGNGYFTDAGISHPAALANGITRSGQGASFGDYDNDGYLDLVTGDWGNTVANSQSRLFRNLGATQPGGFADVTAASGINVYRKDKTYRYVPRFIDLDRDGHLDLTFAADFETSQLFWNNGDGTFTDGTIPAGVGTDFNGMGSTFGDYDSDGDLDWFITNITNDPQYPGPFGGFNRLYRNEGNRTFTDVTLAAGVRDSRWSWGTTFLDYDNDGDVDLTATNGYNGPGWVNDRTFLWQNNGGVFTDVSNASGITDTEQGRGLIHLDYDEDGDLDLVVINNTAAPILYRNDGGNDNHYLRIKPQGTVSNRDGIGAWITVTPDLANPDDILVWEIDGGSSFVSQNEHIAHFGLGTSTDSIDLVTIEWTSGIIQHLYDVAIDQTLLVIEAPDSTPGDFDGDGGVDGRDFLVWQRGGSPSPFSPGDLATWQGAYNGGALAAVNTVPEPASLALLAVMGSLLAIGRGQRVR